VRRVGAPDGAPGGAARRGGAGGARARAERRGAGGCLSSLLAWGWAGSV